MTPTTATRHSTPSWPTAARCCRPPVAAPAPGAAPGSAAAGGPADRHARSGPILSEARATIGDVPRWDDVPMVGRADELARLLAHVDRAAAGGRARSCSPATPASARPGCSTSSTARAAERGRPRADRALRRPRRRRPALPALRRPAAPGRRRPRARRRTRRPTRCSPGCSPAARRRPAGAAAPTAATSAARCRTARPPSRSTTAGCSCSSPSRALLCELAAAGPLLIVLEDVHWADRSSRDLLRYLLARLVDEPVAVVASYRSDDLHRRHPLRPLLAELVRLPGRRAAGARPAAGRRGRRAGPRPGRGGAGCRRRTSRTSSPAPRATRSTRRSCSPPACTARPCRWR